MGQTNTTFQQKTPLGQKKKLGKAVLKHTGPRATQGNHLSADTSKDAKDSDLLSGKQLPPSCTLIPPSRKDGYNGLAVSPPPKKDTLNS